MHVCMQFDVYLIYLIVTIRIIENDGKARVSCGFANVSGMVLNSYGDASCSHVSSRGSVI